MRGEGGSGSAAGAAASDVVSDVAVGVSTPSALASSDEKSEPSARAAEIGTAPKEERTASASGATGVGRDMDDDSLGCVRADVAPVFRLAAALDGDAAAADIWNEAEQT